MFFFKVTYRLLSAMIPIILVTACSTGTIPERRTDKIYFLSNRDAEKREFDIFSMNPDGSEQRNLTRHTPGIRSYSKPCISHDGKTILFVTLHELKKSIQSLTIRDSLATTLTELQVLPPTLCFSPDDHTILFTDQVDGKSQIFTIDHDGSNKRNLSNNEYDNLKPAFSPDGSLICYEMRQGNNTSVAMMRSDGTEQIVLTSDGGNEADPSFSPDGKHILFSSDRNETVDIFLIKISNRKVTPIYTEKTTDQNPQFMPDGKSIIFISDFRGKTCRDVLLLELKTQKPLWLTKTENRLNHNPIVFPDGTAVLFETSDFINTDIIKVDLQDLTHKNLSNHPRWDILPAL
ncbi:DUF5050 domain-containing protein [candidate division KSB1 bacterium]|nr:PD40 domain-containing protein [candidate division KSB1 bacterium]RQW02345.1 MAG: DUF5050 domain-containing protein [candidate division KSB1 bacterium]